MLDDEGDQDVPNHIEMCEESTLKKIDANYEKEEGIVDFGDFTGTVIIEGTLDIRRFIDTAMNLPTFKSKNRGGN